MMFLFFVSFWVRLGLKYLHSHKGQLAKPQQAWPKDGRCEKGVRQDDLASSVGIVADMSGVESEAE